jgi:hypothetical protein
MIVIVAEPLGLVAGKGCGRAAGSYTAACQRERQKRGAQRRDFPRLRSDCGVDLERLALVLSLWRRVADFRRAK